MLILFLGFSGALLRADGYCQSFKDAGISAQRAIDVINTSVSVKMDELGDSLLIFFRR